MRRIRSIHEGFTLIELLIVVAIIAILAAIAVPNFLEAQTRAKVSRVRADLRTLGTAIEAYNVDYNQYPLHMLVEQTRLTGDTVDPWLPPAAAPGSWNEFHFSRSNSLTTPVSYITSYPLDPFFQANAPLNPGSSQAGTNINPIRQEYEYSNSKFGSTSQTTVDGFFMIYGGYRVWSGGPDHFRRDIYLRSPTTDAMRIYDPTNGTVSVGDVWRTQRSSDGSRPFVRGFVE